MQISVRTNLKPLQRQAKLTKKQTVFATANTLTKTAKRVERFEQIKIKKDLDRPTPFTQKGFKAFRATPRRLSAGVFIKDIQFRYLQWQIYGGTQRFRKRKPVPIELKTNKFGNVPRNKTKTMKNNPRYSNVGATKQLTVENFGRGGRYRRVVLWWARVLNYRKRFRFFKHGETVVNRFLVKDWNNAVANEMRRIEARTFKG